MKKVEKVHRVLHDAICEETKKSGKAEGTFSVRHGLRRSSVMSPLENYILFVFGEGEKKLEEMIHIAEVMHNAAR